MPLNPRLKIKLNTGQWNLRRQQKYIWVAWYCRPVRVAFEVKRIFNERISWNKPLTHGNAVVLSTMYLQWESRAVCVVSSVNEVHLFLCLSADAWLVIELPKPCVRLIICGFPRSLSSLWVLCMRMWHQKSQIIGCHKQGLHQDWEWQMDPCQMNLQRDSAVNLHFENVKTFQRNRNKSNSILTVISIHLGDFNSFEFSIWIKFTF